MSGRGARPIGEMTVDRKQIADRPRGPTQEAARAALFARPIPQRKFFEQVNSLTRRRRRPQTASDAVPPHFSSHEVQGS